MITGVIGFIILLVLLFIRVPIGLSLFAVGFGGIWYLTELNVANSVAHIAIIGALGSDVVVLPLFILIGSLAVASGIAGDAYDAARVWFGKFPGGLGLSTIAASSGFAAVSGSSVASAVAMGRLSIPEMRKAGYKDSLIAGIIGSGGLLAVLIPPSGVLVLYGILTGESIGQLLLAAIIPGILLGFSFMAGVFIKAKLDPNSAPLIDSDYTWKERFKALYKVRGVFIIFTVVFVGIFTGIFTITESAAFGALIALILLIIQARKGSFWKKFTNACVESSRTSIMIFFLFLSAYMFTQFIIQAGLPQAITATITGLDVSPMIVIIIMIICYIILGMFLDSGAIILLTVPIFYPIIDSFGVDGIWFGIILVLMIEIGLLTPPYGLVSFTIDAIAPEIGIINVFKGAAMFILIQLLVVVIIMIFPQIVLWLPSIMK